MVEPSLLPQPCSGSHIRVRSSWQWHAVHKIEGLRSKCCISLPSSARLAVPAMMSATTDIVPRLAALAIVPSAGQPVAHWSQLNIEVEFPQDMWWSMPKFISDDILKKVFERGETEVLYAWDWKGSRPGSWRPDEQATSFNRYVIDFVTMTQRNLDNERTRKVRVVHVVKS